MYENTNVIVLDDSSNFKRSDFEISDNHIKIKNKKFKGPGIIKIWWNQCPPCLQKVPLLIALANALKDHNTGIYIYSFEGTSESNSVLGNRLLAGGFPTFRNVNRDGTIDISKSLNINSVEDIINEFMKNE